MPPNIASIILAAGKGTRMLSRRPKVLHRILGRPLVLFPVRLAAEVGARPTVVVLGHGADEVRQVLPPEVQVAIQPEQRGTADAVRVGLSALAGFDGKVLVLSGDVPLLGAGTVKQLLELPGPVALVTALAGDPTGYGRVVRGRDGRIERIVEERDTSPAERQISEINAGIYCFDAAFLRERLGGLRDDNAQSELYLPDLVAAAAPRVASLAAPMAEIAGINDRRELSVAEAALRARVNAEHQRNGVTLGDPATTYIDLDVEIGRDVSIEPGCVLAAGTVVAEGAEIRAHSVLEGARVGPGCVVGPFARLRPGTELAAGVHIGNFVETKKARIGEGSKANHHAYLGDIEIGKRVNVGAGTITCNYDGQKKSLTRLGDGVFIGSDTQLVAPVTVGDGAYVGAGTTVQEDVPEDALVFTRAPRVVKEGWAKRRREKAKK